MLKHKDYATRDESPIEVKKLKKQKSYGTLPSNDSQTTKASQRRPHSPKLPQAISGRNHRGYGAVFICMSLVLAFLFWSTSRYNTAVPKPSLPPSSSQDEHDAYYIWLIEHDEDAYDLGLATLKSLYAIVNSSTNNTEDCESVIETSSWKLDRGSYADLSLDDVPSKPDKYNKVLGADVVFCDRAGYDSAPSSQSRECLVFENSYFSLNGYQQRWPPVNTLDVSPNLSLAYRPPFDGPHRAKPCICQGNKAGIPRFIAMAAKHGLLLIVDCPDWIPIGPTTMSERNGITSFIHRRRRATDVFPAPAPGFYMVPAERSELYAVNMRNRTKNESNEAKFSDQFLVIPCVSIVPEQSGLSKKQDLYSPERRLCRAFTMGCSQANGVAILSRSAVHDKGLPTYQYVVYIVIGVLIFFIALAATGHAVKRKMQYRAKLKTKWPAPHSNEQSLTPQQAHDHVVLEEPENTPNPALDSRAYPWHHNLWQRGQVIFSISKWKKSYMRSRPGDGRMTSELDEIEKGNSPRKLQKKRGTNPEGHTDLPVRIMPPASALPPRMSSGESAASAAVDNCDVDRNTQNQRGAEEGSSTAQRTVPTNAAATRQSIHNSSS